MFNKRQAKAEIIQMVIFQKSDVHVEENVYWWRGSHLK